MQAHEVLVRITYAQIHCLDVLSHLYCGTRYLIFGLSLSLLPNCMHASSDAQACLSIPYSHMQNAEKVTHTKWRLLDQAVMGISLKGKNLHPEGANPFLYEQFLIVWKITFITLSNLP